MLTNEILRKTFQEILEYLKYYNKDNIIDIKYTFHYLLELRINLLK